jgi:predicted SAM-dependent methyltransferase
LRANGTTQRPVECPGDDTLQAPPQPLRLHVGSGRLPLPGWVNIDIQAFPEVDRVLDVRKGLPFRNAEAIYAEHFLEHLELEETLAFLRSARKALAPDGILRLSTPNLDWVYLCLYRVNSAPPQEGLRLCFEINKAFHGWGHRFLFNGPMLTAALRSAGFERVDFCRYGESAVPFLRNLERHEKSPDTPELPHVLIAEASGLGEGVPIPPELLTDYRLVLSLR